ncbi:MAG: rhamnulokinase [Lactovum sp.]
MAKYLAIDIGASSGRAIVADLDNELVLDEINRFTIDIIKGNQERLNLEKLEKDVLESIQRALDKYSDINSIGIDSWAVDTVAIDKEGRPVDNPMFYRDESFVQALNDYKSQSDLFDLYQKTGIQIQAFNSFFQMRVAEENYEMKKVDSFLMLPDYLAYKLSDVKSLEFTNATTMQSFDLKNYEMFCEHKEKFEKISEERRLGKLKAEYAQGQDIMVVSVATHDTASAILAIPHLQKEDAFLSSGTWSLLGKHVIKPITSQEAFNYNYSNEGNYDKTYRFQKNIMGLWLIVSYAKEQGLTDFALLNEQARQSKNDSLINVNSAIFMNPESMTEAILAYCKESQQELPKDSGDFARVIYRSLAKSYKQAILELESASAEPIKSLTIVGGGAKADFLNEEIHRILSQEIRLFPYECSALGNILVQAIEMGQFKNLKAAHDYLSQQLEIKILGE